MTKQQIQELEDERLIYYNNLKINGLNQLISLEWEKDKLENLNKYKQLLLTQNREIVISRKITNQSRQAEKAYQQKIRNKND